MISIPRKQIRVIVLCVISAIAVFTNGCSMVYRGLEVECRSGESARINGSVVLLPFILDGDDSRCIPRWLDQPYNAMVPSVDEIADTLNDQLYAELQSKYPETRIVGTYYADSLLESMPAMSLEKAILVVSHEFRCPNVMVLRISNIRSSQPDGRYDSHGRWNHRADPQRSMLIKANTALSLYDNAAQARWTVRNSIQAECHPMLSQGLGQVSILFAEYLRNGLSNDLQALHDATTTQ